MDEPTYEQRRLDPPVATLIGGLLVAAGAPADLLALNAADNALHVLLAAVLLGVGVIFGGVE